MLVPKRVVIKQSLSRKVTINYQSTGVDLGIEAEYEDLTEEQLVQARKELSEFLYGMLDEEAPKALDSMNDFLKARGIK